MKFALIGAAGYVAPKHMEAIRHVRGELVAAYDIHDSVGVLDEYAPDCKFFTRQHEFEAFLYNNRIDWLVVCSPNYTHLEHCLLGLRFGLRVLCEKPLVLTSEEISRLSHAESLSEGSIYVVLQLRYHPSIIDLREKLGSERHRVRLSYCAPRGDWYSKSWKGDAEKSGGVVFNIGIHALDLMTWLFGQVQGVSVLNRSQLTVSGELELERANVSFLFSTDRTLQAKRQLIVDNKEVNLSRDFAASHMRVYERLVNGEGGVRITSAAPAIKAAEAISNG